MKIFFLLILLAALGSCVYKVCEEDRYFPMVEAIRTEYINKTLDEGFSIFAVGGGFTGDIKKIHIDFRYEREMEIPEIRELIVRKEEEFLATINSNREVRPYLHEFPFTFERFRLGFVFINDNGYVDPPFIACAFVCNGDIVYSIDDKEKNRLVTVFEEPYEEAYKIVYGERCSSGKEPERS